MFMTVWSQKMAAAKWTYTAGLVTGFLTLNLLVRLTAERSGRVSFSYLVFAFIFQDAWRSLTHLPGEVRTFEVGVVLFFIASVVVFRAILALFGTKMQIMGWILLVVLFVSALPIFDYRKIVI